MYNMRSSKRLGCIFPRIVHRPAALPPPAHAAGLNETHFDRVAGHFRDCLLELGAPEPLVAEALTILATARPIFERQPKAVPAAGPSPEDTAAIASHLQVGLGVGRFFRATCIL